MLIYCGSIVLVCLIILIRNFRRQGNSLDLQQGEPTLNLPVIEFDEYEDKYGDELKAEIDDVYNLWYYGKERYTEIMNVTKLKIALENRSCVYLDTDNTDDIIGLNDISEYKILKMVDVYVAGKKFNMYDIAVHDAIYECEQIINQMANDAKREHEAREEQKHRSTVIVDGMKYSYDKRYETSEQAVTRITKHIELSEEQEIKRKQQVIEFIKKNGFTSSENKPIPPLYNPFRKYMTDNHLYNPFNRGMSNYL